MNKQQREFDIFQKEFTKYQKLLGLTGYKVYFRHEPLDGCFANITLNQRDMMATVRLNSILPPEVVPSRNVKQCARHEACHMLLGRLETLAECRYIREDEVDEVCEEIVHKLEEILP